MLTPRGASRRPRRTLALLLTLTLLALIGLVGCAAPAPAPDAATDEKAPRPSGLVLETPQATPGFVLFSPLLSSNTYLVDRQGRTVHVWESEYAPSSVYLLDDGSLLRTGRDPDALGFKAGGVTGIVQRIAWDGTILWEWKLSTEKEILHHDIEPMPNGHFLSIGWEVKSKEEAVAAGRDPETISKQGLWPDFVVEVEPLPDNDARIVWRWNVWDHLVQSRDPDAPGYGQLAAHPGRIDLNPSAVELDPEQIAQLKALGYIPDDAEEPEEGEPEPDYLHVNAIDYNADLDQIALSVPDLGEIWILDHSTTTEEARGEKGELLYRWGNPRAYGLGTAEDQKLFYQHNVEWLPKGFERAGNLTVFNNGGGRPGGESYSEILEIAPPLAADGTYTRATDGPWGPSEPVWSYSEKDKFFAPFISGVQRLANGHTLVCSGPQGRFFEIDPAGAIVWEYWNPYHGNVRNRDGSAPQPVDEFTMAVFRATHVAPDHPALAGRTLTALDPQPAFGEEIEYTDDSAEEADAKAGETDEATGADGG